MTCFHVTFGESLHASLLCVQHCCLLSPAPPGSSSEPGALVFYIMLIPQNGFQHLSAEHLPPAGFLHPNADLTPSTHLTQSADQAYPRWRSWVTHARQRVLIKQAHSCQLSTRWRSRVLKTCSCKLDWCFTLPHISLFSWGTYIILRTRNFYSGNKESP